MTKQVLFRFGARPDLELIVATSLRGDLARDMLHWVIFGRGGSDILDYFLIRSSHYLLHDGLDRVAAIVALQLLEGRGYRFQGVAVIELLL